MTRSEQISFMINELMPDSAIPKKETDKWILLRSLMNLRQPGPVSETFLQVQDAFLKAEIKRKGITRLESLQPVSDGIYLWKGDITTLAVDAIVNAANSGLTGCYYPCHGCIDNAIHTYAGVQLRNACAEIMNRQHHAEPTSQTKITEAYNLPSRYVIHTVGPIVDGSLTYKHRKQLAQYYHSCLELTNVLDLDSIAFCCLSTGEFHFPNEEAARIASNTVRLFLQQHNHKRIIFNVYKDLDENLYKELLSQKWYRL